MKRLCAALLFVVLLPLYSCHKTPPHAMGLVFDEEAYNAVPRKARLLKRDYENLPTQVNLVDYTPYPGDQGNFGTCAAWASTYAAITTAESVQKGRTGRNETTSSVFSPYYLYQKVNPLDTKAEHGMPLERALSYLKYNGVPRRVQAEVRMRAAFDRFNADEVYDGAELFKIGDYATLFDVWSNSETKVSAVKKSLSEKKPVLISFNVPHSFNRAGEKWAAASGEQGEGWHAMMVLGYDDSLAVGSHDGAFYVQNSWGTDWGRGGYVWIDYDDFAEYTRGAYEMSVAVFGSAPEPVPAPQPVPKPEPVPLPGPSFDEPSPLPTPQPKNIRAYKGKFSLPIWHQKNSLDVAYKDGIYQTVHAYDSFTKFQLYMTNEEPCYVYAFASDEATGKATPLFPLENTSALLDYSSNTIVYPSEETCIQLDAVEGTDYMVVLYSPTELSLINIMEAYEAAVNSGLTGKNKLYARLERAVGKDALMQPKNITYSASAIDFEGYVSATEKRKILPVLISIDHE